MQLPLKYSSFTFKRMPKNRQQKQSNQNEQSEGHMQVMVWSKHNYRQWHSLPIKKWRMVVKPFKEIKWKISV
jgi:hypothetical protein